MSSMANYSHFTVQKGFTQYAPNIHGKLFLYEDLSDQSSNGHKNLNNLMIVIIGEHKNRYTEIRSYQSKETPTFIPLIKLSLKNLGWTLEETIDARNRLSSFEEDWEAPGMELYDEL